MEPQYISKEEASKRLGVSRGTLQYYEKTLKLETIKFPLDKKRYLKMADFQKLMELKKSAGSPCR